MITPNSNRGFTLIELLVVITIIGLLTGIVLASLATARNKGTDAAILSSMNSFRASAENIGTQPNGMMNYNTPSVVAGVCGITTKKIVESIDAKNGGSPAMSNTRCNVKKTSWLLSSQMVVDKTKYICLDSRGVMLFNLTSLPADDDFRCD